MLRTVRATRYVTPLREGGSLPAIVEADDLGLYVLKFRGAGQGSLALVAELIGGEIGRALGLPVPELVLVEVDETLGRNEPDEEIRYLLRASAGLNLALDYLPGSVMFNPAAGDKAEARLASQAVWFDAFITNVDRTVRNPNLLLWHKALYFIDHGAALYFQHDWERNRQNLEITARAPFGAIGQHLLLPWASEIAEQAVELESRLDRSRFTAIVDQVPGEWLPPQAKRADYIDYLDKRLTASSTFVKEALRARAQLV